MPLQGGIGGEVLVRGRCPRLRLAWAFGPTEGGWTNADLRFRNLRFETRKLLKQLVDVRSAGESTFMNEGVNESSQFVLHDQGCLL